MAGADGRHAGHPLGAAQLNATASVPGTFVYEPPAGAVLAAGTHTLRATFTPSDTALYSTATASTTLVVNGPGMTPTVSWVTPAAIVQGTPLGAMQLNATASVPGTFVYSPAAGTVLAAGAYRLRVTFTPTDTALYPTATASTRLIVDPPTRVMVLTGSLAFGSVQVGATATAQLTITNSGNTTLTVTGIAVPSGYAANWTSGTIAPGASRYVTVTFAPAAAQTYNGTLVVNADQTGGTNTIAISGTGTAPPTRIISLTGTWRSAACRSGRRPPPS